MSSLTQAQKDTITDLSLKHGLESVRIFGSMARGDAGVASDLDLLVRFAEPTTLYQVIGFKQALEESLLVRVDVVEEGGLSPYLKDRILSEAVSL